MRRTSSSPQRPSAATEACPIMGTLPTDLHGDTANMAQMSEYIRSPNAASAEAVDTGAPSSPLDPIPDEECFEFAEDAQACRQAIRFLAFNTQVEIALYGSSEEGGFEHNRKPVQAALQGAKSLCRDYERLFSRTLPHSDISRVNHAKGQPVRIDPRTFQLLVRAKEYCELSRGTFDITIGPAIKLWDFKNGIVPDEGALARAIEHVRWQNLHLFEKGLGVYFAQLGDPEAALDVGGIAKGWIADALLDNLMSQGFMGAMANLGGNVAVAGHKPNAEPWNVGIRDPRNGNATIGKVSLEGGSVVTSGIAERSFSKDDKVYHHILDPRTGMPVRSDALSVTVVCARSIDAEGFSTTLLALGSEEGSKLACEHPEIAQAIFVTKEGGLVMART